MSIGSLPISSAPISAEAASSAPVADGTVYGVDYSYIDVVAQAQYDELNVDFGSVSESPVAEDTQSAESLPYSSFDNFIIDASDDWTDWSWAQAPPIDDNDTEFQQSSVSLDDQDFTDTADYGAQTEQAIPDENPETAPSSLDDQDFTDLSDYGFVQDPGQEQDHHLGTGEGLDDQDFTDLSDYGSSADPLSEDFVAPEDFILGVALDDQDFTDTADYGHSSDPAIDDNNPEISPSSLDEQDFTDTADYGFSLDPTSEDFVLREDFVLGDGQGLDDQDFTDTADYGSSLDQLAADFIPPQDFILGDGKGLDDQDFTDTSDYSSYSFLTPESTTIVVVNGVDITVQVGCFHVYGFGAIPDPSSTVWTPASNASTTWNQVADPGTPVWTVTPNGSTTWSGISDPANPGWEEDC